MSKKYKIYPITRDMAAPFIIGIHYAHRFPSITYLYGLFLDGDIIGCVSYGTPPSSTLRNGIAGPEMAEKVLELNRLCLKTNEKNQASYLVGNTLKLLGDKIIVSFADTSQNHTGTVYQACNFFYTGLSAKRTDWAIKGQEHKHSVTIADEFRGKKNRAQIMREKYGENFYLKKRARKHRYVYISGSKTFKKQTLKKIRYEILPYPKQQTERKENEK